MKNAKLNQALKVKNDEFYTQSLDIKKELEHYKNHFRNKIVYCNCDNPEWSNFWDYFSINFEHLGLKKIIATHYSSDGNSYKLEISNNKNFSINNTIKTPLIGDGDFRSNECIEILKEADIVVTNPPFSLFREYMAQLEEYDKQFVIIGNINAISYKEVFRLIKNDKLWLGYNTIRHFKQPDGTIYETARSFWYTNLDIPRRHKDFVLYKTYNEKEYLKYDNYEAINVNKAKEIPMDYNGVMGVPITFLANCNPSQFEILGNEYDLNIEGGRGYINSKRMYSRIFIKRVENNEKN